jgi:hypothetical protein
MERRKLLATIGSLAAGGAAATGTSAFTSVSANRDINVSVADDADALLALKQGAAGGGNPNAQYVTDDSGRLKIDLDNSDTANGGSGVNKDAVTDIDDLLHVVNQGTQTVAAWVTEGSSNDAVTFYDGTQGGPDDASIEGQGNAVELDVGDALDVSLEVDTTSSASDDPTSLSTVTFHADAEVDAGDVGGGQPTGGPTGGEVTVSGPSDGFASTNGFNPAFDVRGRIGDGGNGGGSQTYELEIRDQQATVPASESQLVWGDEESYNFVMNYTGDGEAEFQVNGSSTQRVSVTEPSSDGKVAIQAKSRLSGGSVDVSNVTLGGVSIGSTDGVSSSSGVSRIEADGADFSQPFTIEGTVSFDYPDDATFGPSGVSEEGLVFSIIVE